MNLIRINLSLLTCNGFNAVELADEVRISLNVPENVAKTRSMIESLNETNTFIQLEKETALPRV